MGPLQNLSQAAACYLSNHLKVKDYPVKTLAQGHNKRTCRFDLHAIPLMLNVKQGSYEYQRFKGVLYPNFRLFSFELKEN